MKTLHLVACILLLQGTAMVDPATGSWNNSGNNCATVSVTGTTTDQGCTCATLSVSICFNASNNLVSFQPNATGYVPLSGKVTEATTLVPNGGGNPIGGNDHTVTATIDEHGNASGTSNIVPTARDLISGHPNPTSVTSVITYKFDTKIGNCTCHYTCTATITHNTTNATTTGGTAQ